jgi:hypothetical protein
MKLNSQFVSCPAIWEGWKKTFICTVFHGVKLQDWNLNFKWHFFFSSCIKLYVSSSLVTLTLLETKKISFKKRTLFSLIFHSDFFPFHNTNKKKVKKIFLFSFSLSHTFFLSHLLTHRKVFPFLSHYSSFMLFSLFILTWNINVKLFFRMKIFFLFFIKFHENLLSHFLFSSKYIFSISSW